MKKIILLLFLITSVSESMPLDSNLFKYFPLKVGNRWTWFRGTLISPGPGYEAMKIQGTLNANNHTYFISKYDVYLFNGNLYYTTNLHYRIDSVSGNLLIYSTQNQTECLSDSLNSSRGDSANCTCGYGWYRYDTSSHNIFNQSFQAKLFSWSNYFEAGGFRKYAKGIGRVHERNFAVMNFVEFTLRGCLIDGVLYGDTSIVGFVQISSEVPETFSLSQNYPNPFNPVTNVKFQIPKYGFVKLVVFDVLGREIETLVNEELSPGTYEVEWDASNYPSGVYYYKLTAQDFSETKKMVLVK
ncbi:MAG: T9SS type A sorting domain-containing protein [Chlorobi bacterium]|nr:T9SS type A sorting domain-containing protein [Chlorobiota bacterium]MCI0715748.1 T9SS type A sorting domain-containing protein [Chlorobiota bacterium]